MTLHSIARFPVYLPLTFSFTHLHMPVYLDYAIFPWTWLKLQQTFIWYNFLISAPNNLANASRLRCAASVWCLFKPPNCQYFIRLLQRLFLCHAMVLNTCFMVLRLHIYPASWTLLENKGYHSLRHVFPIETDRMKGLQETDTQRRLLRNFLLGCNVQHLWCPTA